MCKEREENIFVFAKSELDQCAQPLLFLQNKFKKDTKENFKKKVPRVFQGSFCDVGFEILLLNESYRGYPSRRRASFLLETDSQMPIINK